ncbi:MAG: GNAT family N-acetyltransferase [Cellulomonas sp.]
MAVLTVRPLTQSTWPDFARLVDRHNGVWGGCWCMGFHPEGIGRSKTPAQNRAEKEARVRAVQAHAALVYAIHDDDDVAPTITAAVTTTPRADDDDAPCVGWCQFGSPDELSRIKNLRAYRDGPTELPTWRITCFFVDKAYRGQGVAAAALQGALDEIARLGGGIVESFPEEVTDRTVSSSFLHNATLALFESHGFERTRQLGKHRWLVTAVVPAASGRLTGA